MKKMDDDDDHVTTLSHTWKIMVNDPKSRVLTFTSPEKGTKQEVMIIVTLNHHPNTPLSLTLDATTIDLTATISVLISPIGNTGVIDDAEVAVTRLERSRSRGVKA